MLTKIKNLLPFGGPDGKVEQAAEAVASATADDRTAMRELVENLHYEIVPTKSIDQAIIDLPRAAHVSVTCSPVKGIAATLDIAEHLLALGHHPIPHFASRLVTGGRSALFNVPSTKSLAGIKSLRPC